MKYLVLILMIALCLNTIWAEGEDNTTPAEQPMHDNAVAFVAKVEAFANANYSAEDAAALINEVKGIAENIKAPEEGKTSPADGYQPEAFMAAVDLQMAAAVTAGLNNNNCDYIKVDFQAELSILLKGYIFDMQYGGIQGEGDTIVAIEHANYIADVAALVNNTIEDINYELNPPTQSNNATEEKSFTGNSYLDTVYGGDGYTKTSMKIDFFWGGSGNKWLNRSFKSLMAEFRRYFRGNANIDADLDNLINIWPQSAEVYTMESTYSTPPSNIGTQTYHVSEYGNIEYNKKREGTSLVNDTEYNHDNLSASEKAYYEKQYTVSEENKYKKSTYEARQSFGNSSDYTHNNRTWSGISDGAYNTVKLTTNGREYTMQQHFYTSPLVLDMDGDGNIQASKGEWMPHTYNGSKVVEFDMDGDGFIDITEWVGPNDGLLMINTNTTEISANELFGNAGGYLDGYEKLSLFDKNKNGRIDGEELNALRVWQDKNQDAKVDAGEVSTLIELGITSITVKSDEKFVSSFEQNGMAKKVWDWFPVVFTVKRTR